MKAQLKIYCASQITGKTWEEVDRYYEDITRRLNRMGYTVFNPMVNKGKNKFQGIIAPGNYETTNPCLSNKAIKKRDCWMVKQADVVLFDLLGTEKVSIGMVSELAWADLLGKHTVVLMEETNIHNHAFVLEESDVIFQNRVEVYLYLNKLINQEV